MPASLLAFAMLARSGPFDALFFCTPAVLPAEDHKLANISPPLATTGLPVGFPSVAADVDEPNDDWLALEGIFGREEKADMPEEPLFMDALTDV